MEERTEDGSRCVIRRTGIVEEIRKDAVCLDIGGKKLTVPRGKTAEAIAVGETVVWNGNIWLASEGGDSGTTNMRKA